VRGRSVKEDKPVNKVFQKGVFPLDGSHMAALRGDHERRLRRILVGCGLAFWGGLGTSHRVSILRLGKDRGKCRGKGKRDWPKPPRSKQLIRKKPTSIGALFAGIDRGEDAKAASGVLTARKNERSQEQTAGC